jgi:hypothetical protein
MATLYKLPAGEAKRPVSPVNSNSDHVTAARVTAQQAARELAIGLRLASAWKMAISRS